MGSKEARYVYPPVHLSRSIREEAQASEAFFAATVSSSPKAEINGDEKRNASATGRFGAHHRYDRGARTFARFDGVPVVGFNILRAKGASDVTLAEAVAARIETIKAANPGVGLKLIDTSVTHTIGNCPLPGLKPMRPQSVDEQAPCCRPRLGAIP